VIGVDTNVFIRFIIDDNRAQHEAATGLLTAASAIDPILVHPIAWVEAAWVLRSKLKLTRDQIADVLAVSLVSDRSRMPEAGACEAALEDFRANKADIAECLMAHLNAASGCTTTYTFDKDAAARLDGAELLKG
jgi:predicted nucleic-acid-binding protein